MIDTASIQTLKISNSQYPISNKKLNVKSCCRPLEIGNFTLLSPRRSMDRTWVSETQNVGSIPTGGTIIKKSKVPTARWRGPAYKRKNDKCQMNNKPMETHKQTKQHRPFELVDYDPKWKEWFQMYSEMIRPILGDNLIEIHHMGSTAIEGMVAKPQIDILAVVKNLDSIPQLYKTFEEKGFICRGKEYVKNDGVGIGDEYVTLDSPEGKRLTSIHIFQEGNPKIDEQLIFQRYLSSHPDDKVLYIKTKKELYKKYSNNYHEYDSGKGPVLKEIKTRARHWFEHKKIQ